MRVVAEQRGEAIRVYGLAASGIPDGTYLVNIDGVTSTQLMTEAEYTARGFHATDAIPTTAPVITGRRTKPETLTVPKAFPMTATSERIVAALTETPMSTADIAKVTKLNKSSVSRELGRLTKAHLAEQHGRGSYSLGRKAAR